VEEDELEESGSALEVGLLVELAVASVVLVELSVVEPLVLFKSGMGGSSSP